MTFPHKLLLPNRYGDKNYLEFFDTKVNEDNHTTGMYKLVQQNNIPFRAGVRDGKFWVDPSGGPMLSSGYTIENLEITRVATIKDEIYVDLVFNRNVL